MQTVGNICIKHGIIVNPDFANLECQDFKTNFDNHSNLSRLIMMTPEGIVICSPCFNHSNNPWTTAFDLQSRDQITKNLQKSLFDSLFPEFGPKLTQLLKVVNPQTNLTLSQNQIKELSESPSIKEDLLKLANSYDYIEDSKSFIMNTIMYFLNNKPLLKSPQLETSIKNELNKILTDDYS